MSLISNTWFVIPAAGNSDRFRAAGYHVHKPLLKIRSYNGTEKSMLAHVINSFPQHTIPLIGLPCGVEFPQDVCAYFSIIRRSRGQADTIYQLIKRLPPSHRVVIADCDVVLESSAIEVLLEALNSFDVAVAVTNSTDPNMSRVDQVPYPTRFVEKESISDWGIVGVRAFRNVGQLVTVLENYLNQRKDGEFYFSPAITGYPGTKFALVITNWGDWGTPERLEKSGATVLSERS